MLDTNFLRGLDFAAGLYGPSQKVGAGAGIRGGVIWSAAESVSYSVRGETDIRYGVIWTVAESVSSA